MTGSLEVTDQESIAVQKPGTSRVTLDSMKARVSSTEFMHPKGAPHMTVCVLYVDNGYMIVGKSTPADVNNFNPELGKKFAEEDALRQMWPLEGYLLRQALSEPA